MNINNDENKDDVYDRLNENANNENKDIENENRFKQPRILYFFFLFVLYHSTPLFYFNLIVL